MRRLLLLLPFLIFSTPAHAQELNLECGLEKFYMRDGEPTGVVEGMLGDRHRTNVFWQGDTIIIKWVRYIGGNMDLPVRKQVDINRSTGKSAEVVGAETFSFDCKRIESAPRKF